MDAKLTFGDAVSQLQEVVNKLEQGELSLEMVTELYEQGVTLAANCRRLLEGTESNIKLIQRTYEVPPDSGEPGSQ